MSNPILNNKRFSLQSQVLDGEPMTVQGTVNKLFMLFVCLLAGAGISLHLLFGGQQAFLMSLICPATIIAFVLVLITCFDIKRAKYLAPPYAFCQGIFLGGISAMFETAMQGIVLQAVIITFATMFIILMLYKSRKIQYTEKFRSFILTATLSIGAVYLVQIIVSLFGRSIPSIFSNDPIGILFSLIVVLIAAFSLIQDFYFIETASQNMLSKDYEWYGAMGLMITLIWLYMEILKLLVKINSRR